MNEHDPETVVLLLFSIEKEKTLKPVRTGSQRTGRRG
jgi:hypothetical protein